MASHIIPSKNQVDDRKCRYVLLNNHLGTSRAEAICMPRA